MNAAEKMKLINILLRWDAIVLTATMNWLSYKLESTCAEALLERLDLLELYLSHSDRKKVKKLGQQMKERLLSIEHDTDDFPEILLEEIDKIIS